MQNFNGESGPEFEFRGLTIARALHDPLGSQGAIMHKGLERDGLFVSHDDIHAYEFTVSGKKDKALKDGAKLAELVRELGSDPAHSYKARTGWFVTREEPTAEQRSAIASIAQNTHEKIHAISISTLYQRICNSDMYLQARDRAPFGSISFGKPEPNKSPNVPVKLQGTVDETIDVHAMASLLIEGNRALLVGNYGVGKSHTLREIYFLLRKFHFRRKKMTPFPVHINLRDCAGLKTPSEILRRHAEEVGFDHPNGLISAWRAGACILLLDGFDEVIPSRWFGNATDLKTVRWEALNPIRRLVSETPAKTGIVVAGRSHYFSGDAEMVEALGFSTFEKFNVPDFDELQLQEFLDQAGIAWEVPDWVPMRPLLLGYLISFGVEDAESVAASVSRATGWQRFIHAICEREARMFSGVRPEIIKNILSRVATLARSRSDATGPVDMEMLRSAFTAVNGRQPDEEGVQLLLRLPGLANNSDSDELESRVFVDRDLADTAYGLDLKEYAVNPYNEAHPLTSVASWANASSELGIEVAAEALDTLKLGPKEVVQALVMRDKDGQYDAVMADLIRVGTEIPRENPREPSKTFLVTGVYFDSLLLSNHPLYKVTTFQDCVFEKLDLNVIDENSHVPHFNNCIFGMVDGVSSIPSWLDENFTNCEFSGFSIEAKTTSGILQLALDRRTRIALTIFKKIFSQQGAARKESALSRGLSLTDREHVPEVIDELISQGWIIRSTAGNNILYKGQRSRRSEALRLLDSPLDFKL